MKISNSSKSNFSDKVRFNWGYFDGLNNFGNRSLNWCDTHFDKHYGSGYRKALEEKFNDVNL